MIRIVAAGLFLFFAESVSLAQNISISYPVSWASSLGNPLPFYGLSIVDSNVGATSDVVTITMIGPAGGSLSSNSLSAGATLVGSGPYTLTTTPPNLAADIQSLVYVPLDLANTTEDFSLSVTSYQTILLGTASASTIELNNLALTDETPFSAPVGTFTPRNFKGVNIAGAENSYPSSSQYNYIYPAAMELDYWSSKGMGLIRMPLQLRRLQPVSYGPLDPVGRMDEPAVAGSTSGTQTNLLSIKAVLDRAFTEGLYIIIEPHNYGYIHDTVTNTDRLIGSDAEATAQFIDWWVRMATKFKNYPNVIFGLMNEPHIQSASDWKLGAVAAINAIAQVTTSRWVFVPGTSWTGGHSWVSSGNAAAWTGYSPPAGMQIAFDMHEYLDSDYSGTHPACAGFGSAPMAATVGWAQTNGFKIHIGEIGWSQDASCPADAGAIMSYFSTSQPTIMGWAYWVGGSQAFYGSYSYTAQPSGYPTGPFVDKPQTSVLTANLP